MKPAISTAGIRGILQCRLSEAPLRIFRLSQLILRGEIMFTLPNKLAHCDESASVKQLYRGVKSELV
jgi:hypothetical protein